MQRPHRLPRSFLGLELSLALCLVGFPEGRIGNRRRRPRLLVHESAKQSRKAAELFFLTLEPGVQPALGDRGRCIAAIKCVGLVDDLFDRTGLRDIIVSRV
jgi:hypothetical protein